MIFSVTTLTWPGEYFPNYQARSVSYRLSTIPLILANWSFSVAVGINGDYLAKGKLDLPEIKNTPSLKELIWAKEFIDIHHWKEATTYREIAPHEYVVKTWEQKFDGKKAFEHFIRLIRQFGYADFYYRIRHIYWPIDDFKYWTMGWPINETIVINRARIDAPEPWKNTKDFGTYIT